MRNSQKEKEHSNQISLTLPEWAKNNNIYIFAGTELLAYLPASDGDRHLLVKTGRCNECGYCCENLGIPFSRKMFEDLKTRILNYDFKEMGRCPLLGDNGCILREYIPFGCARSDCSRFPGCTESFKEVNPSG